MKRQPEIVLLKAIDWVLRASQSSVVCQGLREEGPARDILIRIGIAWLEVGVRERLPGGMGQLSVGTMGSDNEFGVSFSTWGSP